MAKLANIVRVSSATIGTGTLTLGAAITGFLTPTQAGMLDGVQYSYAIEADYVAVGDDLVPTSREVGIGTYTASGTTLSRDTILNSTNSNNALNLAGDEQVIIAFNSSTVREVIPGDRSYYVRTPPATVSFTNASANITWTGHGLSVNSAVVFCVLPQTKTYTVTNANPGVWTVTTGTHGLVAGNPVVFRTTGYLPAGIVPGTTYYVISTGLTTTAFQVSATVGGAAINTSKLTFTAASGTGGALQITNSGTNNLVAGQRVAFSSTTTLPTGLSASTAYYVAASPAPTSTVFYVSTTNGGTNVAFTDAGTGTHSLEQVGGVSSASFGSNTAIHYGEQTGAMPTFSSAGLLVAGTVYYVGTVVDANTITCSTTTGNANPFGTATVATGSPVYSASTGSDSNSGLFNTTSTAFLTINGAYAAIVSAIDFASHVVILQVNDSVYTDGFLFTGWVGGGQMVIQGNTVVPANCFINKSVVGVTPLGSIFETNAPCPGTLSMKGFKFRSTSSARNALSIFNAGRYQISDMEFNGIPASTFATAVSVGAAGVHLTIAGNIAITGSMPGWASCNEPAVMQAFTQTLVLTGVPAFDWNGVFFSNSGCTVGWGGITFLGSATGTRYQITNNGIVDTGGSGTSYLPGNANGFTSTGGQYI